LLLAPDSKSNAWHSLATRFGNLRATFFAMSARGPAVEQAARAFYLIGNRGIDLILHCIVGRPAICHGNLLLKKRKSEASPIN
jgi:hypothetical protein